MKYLIIIFLFFTASIHAQTIGGFISSNYLGNDVFRITVTKYSVDYAVADSIIVSLGDGTRLKVGLVSQISMGGYIKNAYIKDYVYGNGSYFIETEDHDISDNLINVNDSILTFRHFLDYRNPNVFGTMNSVSVASVYFVGNAPVPTINIDIQELDGDSIIYTLLPFLIDGTGSTIPLATNAIMINQNGQIIWDKPVSNGLYGIGVRIREVRYNTIMSDTYLSFVVNVDSSIISFTKPMLKPLFDIQITPNPTSETLHITTETPVDEIQIYNSIGQQVWQGQGFRENQVRVNVRDFSQGMYIVRVRQGEIWGSEQVLVR